MGGDDRTPEVRDLIDGLNEGVRKAGGPSFAELESAARRCLPSRRGGLPHSTVQGHLAGNRKGPPRWELVDTLVNVLRIMVAKGGRDPDEVIGPLAAWKVKHEAALASPGSAAAEPEPAEEEKGQSVGEMVLALAADRPAARRSGPSDSGQARDAYLAAVARQLATLEWWRDFHDLRDVVPSWFAPYLSLEPGAQRIEVYEPQFVPGLLQTRDYAEDVIRLEHGPQRSGIDRRVELRMLRQRILHRPNAPRVWCVLDEVALRRRYGSPETMRAQIRHLIEISHRPNVTLQIMPLAEGGLMAACGPITLLRFLERDVPDVVYLERLQGALYPSDPGEIANFGALFGRLGIEAKKRQATRSLLGRILGEI